ncbi:MAG TPA: amino acid ABC transporter permease, partial [Rhodocyclaceae bacterium]|nr:amino acid ABC transporter permease [Rhodocyclaceae bacterium]
MNYQWNWGIYFELVKGGDETYLDWLITGFGWTVAVALTAWVIASVLGIVFGTLRTSPLRSLVYLSNVWVEVF